jgi:hypothetical protein
VGVCKKWRKSLYVTRLREMPALSTVAAVVFGMRKCAFSKRLFDEKVVGRHASSGHVRIEYAGSRLSMTSTSVLRRSIVVRKTGGND